MLKYCQNATTSGNIRTEHTRKPFQRRLQIFLFDVKSLFTNVPLKKTINIILDRIYNKNEINTTLKKRTLKKLLLDCCTKTPFSINGELFKQIDSVAMGSPLGPTLANIMTTFEDEIVRQLIDSNFF